VMAEMPEMAGEAPENRQGMSVPEEAARKSRPGVNSWKSNWNAAERVVQKMGGHRKERSPTGVQPDWRICKTARRRKAGSLTGTQTDGGMRET
jgi:hypothetical protein